MGCKGCKERHLYCHMNCEVYREFRKNLKKDREAERPLVYTSDFNRVFLLKGKK